MSRHLCAIGALLLVSSSCQSHGSVAAPTAEGRIVNVLDYIEQHKDTNFSKRIASTSTHGINVFHGYRNSKSLHMHAKSDKLIYVISGAGRFELNGRWHDLKRGDVVSVPRGTTHGIHSQGWEKERLVFLYVYTPPMVGKDMHPVDR